MLIRFAIRLDRQGSSVLSTVMRSLGPLGRTVIYSAVGFATEIAFSALHDLKQGNKVRLRTSPWMFPIYALIMPLFEPLHRRVRPSFSVPQRAATYGVAFLAVEYAAGSLLRRTRGDAPWDYSYARVHLHGLIRADYFFLWALAGLALERLHDELTNDG